MRSRPIPRALWLFALAGGIVGLVVALAGSLVLAIASAVVCWAFGFALIHWRSKLDAREDEGAADPSRRRFLAVAGFGGFALAIGGSALGWTVRHLSRPAARPIQEEMAHGLGAEYMELVRRAYHPGRSGDLQLLLAPFNSSNYSFESLHLALLDPRTSHASTWMYLERVPLLVYGPGRIAPSDSVERVSLADLAPTAAQLIGFEGWPPDREGRPLPGMGPRLSPGRKDWSVPIPQPKVIVTFVIDGGGWNVLHQWPDSWPTLKRLMGQSANFRNAIMGSFPAVTACAHATIGTGAYPATHGITGHNIRDGGVVRKAYGEEGNADPSDILVPTLADLWSNAKADLPWIGEIGYQVWHLGMIGRGGPSRTGDNRPVAIYFEERLSIHDWVPQNPQLFRMPTQLPPPGTLAKHKAGFSPPTWDEQFAPQHAAVDCCSPPIVQYQGDVIASTLASEPIGQSGVTDLLYINYKTPDYTGHVYNMLSKWEGLVLEEVDRQLERLVEQLDQQFPNEYVLFVTADHGQCPTPDAVNGVRLDPIQLQEDIEREFGGGIGSVVQSVVPSEVYLYPDRLWDNGGATVEDVAVFLRDYRYRQNIGPYVPTSLVEQNLLDSKEFAAVFGTTFLDTLRGADLNSYGNTVFLDADQGLPTIP